MEPISKDRRYSPRTIVQARMRISHSRIGMLDGFSRDISDKGIFVALEHIPAIPKGAHLALQMLDSVNPNIVFNARVIRSTHTGIAVALVDYELFGQRYTLDELKRQWLFTRPNVPTH